MSLDFAARHPELVTALVLLDAPLPDHDFSDPDFLAYAEEEERLYEAGDLDALAELDISFWAPGLAERLRPTLVGVGEDDKPDFRAIAERLAAEIPGAELAVIPGAGHLPSMEQPEATAALVRHFLKEQSP